MILNKNTNKDINKLIEFKRCLEEKNDIPESIRTWWINAFNRLITGEVKTVDESLNLKPTNGTWKAGPKMKKVLRDTYLVELVNASGFESDSLWFRCTLAAQLIKEFPQKENFDTKTLNQIKQEKILLKLFKLNNKPPSSTKTIFELFGS